MKEWEQPLIMAFVFLTLSATSIVVAVIDSPSCFYGFFLGPSTPSYITYSARALWLVGIGIFALTLGVGLAILACYMCWIQEKKSLSDGPSVSEEDRNANDEDCGQ